MRTDAIIGGTELLLGVIAIRLALLVLVGWGLTLLPRQAGDYQPACFSSSATTIEIQPQAKAIDPRVADAAFADMLRHD